MNTEVILHTQRKKNRLLEILFYAVNAGMVIVFLYPLLCVLLASMKPAAELVLMPPRWWPSVFTLDNFSKLLLSNNNMSRAIMLSGIVSFLTVIGTVLLSTLAGYGFSRFHFRGKNVFFVLILLTMMIPSQPILTPLFIIITKLGLQNNILGLVLVYITFQLPFSIFMMRNTFDSIPKEIDEAAQLDGCSPVKILFRVMPRMVSPGIVTVVVTTFIAAWNEFLVALIFMTDSDNYTMPILLLMTSAGKYGSVDWGLLQACTVFAMLPCIIIFLFLQKHYVSGLTSGATKG
ncbi:carbohydrate ABC transporter permease [Superficieibacter sp.]|uniref:carbohydrate ABC transporter permease n=1 Tax=Superficieibacter sp. TaxID=2303322 RepID=UPI0028ADB6EF|nr:carbohydrate ABC transporter permease [Superficieibacter sp.]